MPALAMPAPADERLIAEPIDAQATTDAASTAASPPAQPAVAHATPRADAAPAHAASAYALSSYARAEPPAQVANAVASLASHGDGAHRLTLRLDPIELGHIEVTIDRQHGMPAAITLSVERPETLLRLMRDQDQLSRALDQAGLAAGDRNLRFQLAGQDAPRAGDADAPRPDIQQAPIQPASQAANQGNDAPPSTLPQRQDGSPDARPQNHGGQHQPGGNRGHASRPGTADPDIVAPAPAAVPPSHHLRLSGVDITA